MNYYLVRYANEDNPIECISADELSHIEKVAEEFDGFTGLHIIKQITEQEAKLWQKQQEKVG